MKRLQISIQPNRTVQLAGARSEVREKTRERLFILMLCMAVLFLIVTWRLFKLTVVEGDQSVSPISVLAQLPLPPRAEILDRNGVVLAKSMPSRSLIVRPDELLDPEAAAAQIKTALPDLDDAYIAGRLEKTAPMRYVKRHLSVAQETYFRRYGDPGLQFENEYRRIYPTGPLAAHVVGFKTEDADRTKWLGVEKFDHRRLSDPEKRTSALRLSIDSRVQHAMRDVLSTGLATYSAVGAVGLVMEIATGEVRAMVSLPDFDPNDVTAYPDIYQLNQATNRVFELGSTFKSFSVAQGLDLNLIEPATVCDGAEPLVLGRKIVYDRWALRRPMTMVQALIRSSNTCIGRLGDAIGPDRQRDFLNSLGLLSDLKIELGERLTYKMSSNWGRFATITISYGHGIAVTPLHLAQATATLLNDGRPVKATLRPQNSDLFDGQVKGGVQMVSSETSRDIRHMLRLAVIHGTGKAADVPGIRVGGKTGTAEVTLDEARGYDKDRNVNTFLGAFPMDAPRYVIVVTVDSPQAIVEGGLRGAGANAAVLAGEFIERSVGFLGVYPDFREESWLGDSMVTLASYDPEDAGWSAQ